MAAAAQFDLTTASLGLPKVLAYGTVRGSGNRVFDQELSDKSRIVFHLLGEGPWDSILRLWVHRKEKTGADLSNYYSMFKGLDGEIGFGMAASSSGLNPTDQHASIFWSNTTGSMDYVTFSRYAYLVGRVNPDPAAPGPDIEILGDFKAMQCRIYDNTGVQTSFAWTDNPAWWILDYHIRKFILREGKVNQPLVAAERARIDWASFKDAADYFDADIGGGIKRFSDGGVVFLDQGLTADRGCEQMLLMSRSYLLERAGKLYLYADQARSSVFTFGIDETIAGTLQVSKFNAREARNRVVASWRESALASGSSDNATRFAPASKNFDNEAHQLAIGARAPGLSPIPKVLEMSLDYGVNTGERVSRLANFQRIRQLGDDVDVNGIYLAPREVSLVGFDNSATFRAIKPGDRVTLHKSLGEEVDGLSFEVMKMRVRPDGSRGFSGLEYNANAFTDSAVVQQTTQAPVPGTGLIPVTGGASYPYRPTTNPLTATDAGADSTIAIASFTMRVAGLDLSINSGSVTGLSFDTLHYVYYDDLGNPLAGGSKTFLATTTKETALSSNRFFVGSIHTPRNGEGDTAGNNDGGAGAQIGTKKIWFYAGTYPKYIDSSGSVADVAFVSSANATFTDTEKAFNTKLDDADYAVLTVNGSASPETATLILQNFTLPRGAYKSITLKIRTQVTTNTLSAAPSNLAVVASWGFPVGANGTFYTLGVGSTRALTTDSVAIPAGENCSQLKVLIQGNSAAGATGQVVIRVIGVWIETEE